VFEVWISDGGGPSCSARFRLLADALRFINGYRAEGSLALRKPDGAWYDFGDGAIVVNRRRTARTPLQRRIHLRHRDVSTEPRLYWGATVDASDGGLRVRLSSGREVLPAGSPVICWLESSHERREICATVAWASGSERGLAIADDQGRATMTDWLHDQSGTDTSGGGLRFVEVRR